MKKKKTKSQSKQPSICFIVEGFTEMHYINVLCEFFEKTYKVHNCKGGGANGVLKAAADFIKINENTYEKYLIVYDTDTRHQVLETVEKREDALSTFDNVILYPLNPCFEYCLLSHFQQPKGNTCNKVIDFLKQNHIPNYEKNNFDQLKKYLTIEKIELMAKKYACNIIQQHFLPQET
jgi:RloB-like protein